MGFVAEPFPPNKFSAAGHSSAVNSLEQELELNTLAMNCSSVIRLILAGYSCIVIIQHILQSPGCWKGKQRERQFIRQCLDLRIFFPWHWPYVKYLTVVAFQASHCQNTLSISEYLQLIPRRLEVQKNLSRENASVSLCVAKSIVHFYD